jgi:hypothetical protein
MDKKLDLYICVDIETSNGPLNWAFNDGKIKLGDKLYVSCDNFGVYAIYNKEKSKIITYMTIEIFIKCFQKLDDFREQKIGEILNV